MQQLSASNGAFAALLEDGQVITWGSPYSGGESAGLQERLGAWDVQTDARRGGEAEL